MADLNDLFLFGDDLDAILGILKRCMSTLPQEMQEQEQTETPYNS